MFIVFRSIFSELGVNFVENVCTQRAPPCQDVGRAVDALVSKGGGIHPRTIAQRFPRPTAASPGGSVDLVRCTSLILEQAAETLGEPPFGASNGPTGDPTPVMFLSDPDKLAALKAELEEKLLQIRGFGVRSAGLEPAAF
jgi:hypothetical protein